jgi:diguanylate cyclase (GGDEF) domain
MDNHLKIKKKILIVDDSEMNRMILSDILEEFEIFEAKDGLEAIKILQKMSRDLSLVLLDIVMPSMDGFGVLEVMNKRHWIEDVPVVMISAESSSSVIEKAYELGVTDFISRPFASSIVYRRVNNTIMLYAKQKKLVGMVTDQIYENERRSRLMVAILSHIVEFRNGESGAHVLHVQVLTDLFLKRLVNKTNQYQLDTAQISLISMASALHDIGKIGIPDHILNKPGKYTDEEFAIMKTHSDLGAKMLAEITEYRDEELMHRAIEICHYHHERYDGKGYPDGLKGEEIPISAQVVSLADVYDALTSERVYKKAFSHEKAIEMILNGECGAFNPLLLECLKDVEDEMKNIRQGNALHHGIDKEITKIADTLHHHEELSSADRAIELLEYERKKYEFFAAMSQEIQFEYIDKPPMLTFSRWGSEKLNLEETIMNPMNDGKLIECFGKENLLKFIHELNKTTKQEPVVQFEFEMGDNEHKRWKKVIAQTIWSSDDTSRYIKFFGKIMDVHEQYTELTNLKQLSSHDGLTGLYNRQMAEHMIIEKMNMRPESQFAFITFDIDNFKCANDQYGHMFGDKVLKQVSKNLLASIRSDDIAARVGGDEFVLFLEYKSSLEKIVDRIFNNLNTQYKDFQISISMGIAKSIDIGNDYQLLYHLADCALYTAKQRGKGCYCMYDESMKDALLETAMEE